MFCPILLLARTVFLAFGMVRHEKRIEINRNKSFPRGRNPGIARHIDDWISLIPGRDPPASRHDGGGDDDDDGVKEDVQGKVLLHHPYLFKKDKYK